MITSESRTVLGLEGIKATMVKDSISRNNVRLTTVQLTYPRFIHSELMTHRMFSRNASSSRAIPVETMLKQVRNDPAKPIFWGSNKPGMQAGEELSGGELYSVKRIWEGAAKRAAHDATELSKYGLHKQVANRILEPWQFMKTIVTATDWENFFELRLHPDAQPEFRELAQCISRVMDNSNPKEISPFNFHLPYIKNEEMKNYSMGDCCRISVARCARVSYLNHDKSDPNPHSDIQLTSKLGQAGHMSPFEHIARPINYETILDWADEDKGITHKTVNGDLYSGNLRGWVQYRHMIS